MSEFLETAARAGWTRMDEDKEAQRGAKQRDHKRRAALVNNIKLYKTPKIIVAIGNLTRFHGDCCEMAIKSRRMSKANNGEIGYETYACKIPYFSIRYNK